MNTLKLITIGLLIVVSTSLSSCKKEGCTDPDGKNYNADAKKDDGSCQYIEGCRDRDAKNYNPDAKIDNGFCSYEGSAILWTDSAAASGLYNDGATSLTYYVNGQIVGSSSATIYWTSRPSCGQNATITITKDLGHVKSLAYTYSVKDQRGKEYWSGVLNFTANGCHNIKLTW